MLVDDRVVQAKDPHVQAVCQGVELAVDPHGIALDDQEVCTIFHNFHDRFAMSNENTRMIVIWAVDSLAASKSGTRECQNQQNYGRHTKHKYSLLQVNLTMIGANLRDDYLP